MCAKTGDGKMKTVVVVGGGITGLCTLHYLKRQMAKKNIEAHLVLIEKNSYFIIGSHGILPSLYGEAGTPKTRI